MKQRIILSAVCFFLSFLLTGCQEEVAKALSTSDQTYSSGATAGRIVSSAQDAPIVQDSQAIIIVGGGWSNMSGTDSYIKIAQLAQSALAYYNIPSTMLRPGEYNLTTVEEKIKSASAKKVIIYFIGASYTDSTGAGFLFQDSENDVSRLSFVDLNDWLTMIEEPGKTVMVIVEAGNSTPLWLCLRGHENRQLIFDGSGAGEFNFATFLANGQGSFGWQFWSNFFVSPNVYDAFVNAREVMQLLLPAQRAFIDMDGDGESNGRPDKDKLRGVDL